MRDRSKQELKELLHNQDWEELAVWSNKTRGAVSKISAFLIHPDPDLQWQAVNALGRISNKIYRNNPDKQRDLIRRLLWGMNDESGSLIRRAPEAIGEILANTPALMEEYGDVLFSFFEEEPFQRGVHWAAARLSAVKPETVTGYKAQLQQSLHSSDPLIRKFSEIALQNIEGEQIIVGLGGYQSPPAPPF